ncbi:MAG: glycosyltransferase [Verrucomicrobiota bacterium]
MKTFTVIKPSLRCFQWVTRNAAFEGAGFDENGNPPLSVQLKLGNRMLECLRVSGRGGGKDDGKVRFRKLFRTGKGFKWVTATAIWEDGKETVVGRFLLLNTAPRPPDPYARDYGFFLSRNEPTKEERRKLGETVRSLPIQPKISVLLPTYNTKPRLLREAIQSVQRQLYPNWELCIADDASTRGATKKLLRRMAAEDNRIRVSFRETNGHISEASNTALEMATGDWIALLDHDDVLRLESLARTVLAMNRKPEVHFFYSDEDKIDEKGRPLGPYFKPDWNPLFLYSQNYICHFSVMRTEAVRSVGGFRKGMEGSQDWDLFLRLGKRLSGDQIAHIPEVLYRWRVIEGSSAANVGEKSYSVDASRRSLEEAVPWSREGSWELIAGMYWICHPPTYEGYRVGDPEELAATAGDLSEDVLIVTSGDYEWEDSVLQKLAGWASLRGMGCVAPALEDADGGLAEAGLLVNPDGIVESIFRDLKPDFEGMGRREILPQNLLVPGRVCFAVRRELWVNYWKVAEPFTSWTYRVAAFCLTLERQGLKNILTPHLRIRGSVPSWNEMNESVELCERYPEVRAGDPGSNPNLTVAEGAFSLQLDSNVPRNWEWKEVNRSAL